MKREKAQFATKTTSQPQREDASVRPRLLRNFGLLALEPRIMFDGAAVATADAVVADACAHVLIPDVPAAVEVRAADPAKDGGKKEVVFVDTSVADYKVLEAGIADGIGIVEIDGSQDGLAQIAQWAASQTGYDSISILSHGSEATLHLGSTTLTDVSLKDAAVQTELSTIGQALTADGDLLLYGCEIAKGSDGQTFIGDLAQATGADVAASTDLTGAAAKGGDWSLEASAGLIETSAVLDAQRLAAYNDVLIDSTLTFETADGNISDAPTTALTFIDDTSGATFTFTAQTASNLADDVALGSKVGGGYQHGAEDVVFGVNDLDKSATMTIESGKVFDLNSFYLSNQSAAQTFTITTSKGGSYTTSSILSDPASYTQITLPNDAAFQGITWFTITPSLSSGAYMEIDDIALTNIVAAPPTATVVVADSALRIGETSAVTFTFSQAVTGFTNADITIANGTLSTVSSSDSGITWTATLTPTAGITDTTNLITLDMTGVTSVSGSTAGAGTQSSNNYAIDTVRPSLASGISISDTALRVGDTATVTFTFTEAVTGFTIADLNTPSAALSNLTTADNITWTATLTPSASTTAASKVITLDYTGITDAAGNAGSGTTDSGNYAIDTAAPTTTISTAAFSADTGSSSTDFITKTAAQTISGTLSANLASGETVYVSLDNGSSWTAATASVFSNVWSLAGQTLTASSTLKIKVTDAAGNDGSVSSQAYVFDTTAPTITFGTIRFSADTGSSNADLITNTAAQTITATLSAVPAGSDVVYGSLDNGSTWTDITTKVSGSTLSWNGVTLAGSDTLLLRVVDAAGNVGSSTSQAYTLDTSAPTAPSLAIKSANDTGTSNSDGITCDATPDVAGTTEANATVKVYDTNGTTLLCTATAHTDGTWSVTPLLNLSEGAHTLTAKAIDAAGNVSAASDPLIITIDTTAPATSSVTVPTNGTYYVGNALDFTVNFNDAVTVDTSGGTPRIAIIVGATTRYADYLSGSGTSALVFRYVVPGGDSDNNGITVGALSSNGGTLIDVAGNDATLTLNSVGSTAGVNVDGSQPSVTSVSASTADGAYGVGQTITLTVDFSRAVTVDTTGGTPTLTLGDGGIATYSAGSGTTTLSFTYTVGAGQNSADLDYSSTSALVLNGATIIETGGSHPNASLTLATPGVAGSLGANKNIVIDTTAPAVSTPVLAVASDSGTSNSDHLTNVTTPTITGTAEVGSYVTLYDTNGTTVLGTATANGSGNWSIISSALADGSHTLTATATDAAGNTSAASTGQSVTIDTTASAVSTPVLAAASDSGTSSSDRLTNVTTPTITGTAEVGSSVTLYDTNGTTVLGTATADGSGNWSITSSTLASGSHTLTAKATDAAGNTSAISSGLAVTIDTTAPSVPTAPVLATASDSGTSSSDHLTNTTAPTITGTAEANATVKLYDTDGTTLLGSATADGSGNWSITSSTLASGSHTLTAKATDVAGNTSAASSGLAVTIDTTAPVVSTPVLSSASDSGTSSSDCLTNVTTPTITGTAEVGSYVTLYDTNGTTVVGTATANGSGNWSITSSALADGSHTLTATATDAAGNTSAASTGLSVTIDTTRPTATIAMTDTALAIGETSQVTITFSEAVSGFNNSDLTVAHGTLSAVSSSDGGKTWTATFTPTANLTSAANLISLNNAGVADLAGNSGVGTTDSASYAIDTTAPQAVTLALVGSPTPAANSVQYTVSFSEDVTGVDAQDFSIVTSAGVVASVSSVTAIDAHTYLVTLGNISGTGSLQLNLLSSGTGITDVVGNEVSAGLAGTVHQVDISVVVPPTEVPVVVVPVVVSPPPPSAPIALVVITALDPAPGVAMPTQVVSPAAPLSIASILQAPVVPNVTSMEVPSPSATSQPFLSVSPSAVADLRAIPDLGAQNLRSDQSFSYVLPATTFVSSDPAARISVEARQSNGQPLPAWLKFDPVTGVLSGRPPANWARTLKLEIIARDSKGHQASSAIELDFSRGERTQSLRPGALLDRLSPAPTPAGRTGLNAQFAQFGSRAHLTERAVLQAHLREAAHTAKAPLQKES